MLMKYVKLLGCKAWWKDTGQGFAQHPSCKGQQVLEIKEVEGVPFGSFGVKGALPELPALLPLQHMLTAERGKRGLHRGVSHPCCSKLCWPVNLPAFLSAYPLRSLALLLPTITQGQEGAQESLQSIPFLSPHDAHRSLAVQCSERSSVNAAQHALPVPWLIQTPYPWKWDLLSPPPKTHNRPQ